MGFNSGKIKVQSTAKKKTKNSAWKNDVVLGSSMADKPTYFVGPSMIQGQGLMAGRQLMPGEPIGISHINGQPTGDIGRYYNHSETPNSQSILIGNNRMIVPLRQLRYGEEITVDYRLQPELEQPSDFRTFQAGGETNPAYQKYKERIASQFDNYKGQVFVPSLEGTEQPDDQNKNCIGGACNYAQIAGADIPIIPGNASFWGQADRGEIPIHIYADPNTEDYSNALDFVQPGDFIGHNWADQQYTPEGVSKNSPFYPEHTNLVKKITGEGDNRVYHVVDAYGPEGYHTKKYTHKQLMEGVYDNTFFGRPTSVGGQKLDFNYPGDTSWYFPKVSEEQLANLKTPKWRVNKDFEGFGDLNERQQKTLTNIAKTLTKRKKDFIEATGMSEADYDQIAAMMPGLSYQETKLGKTNPRTGQYERNVFSGDFKDAYTTRKEDLKQMAGNLLGRATSKGDFQVKEDLLFNNAETKAALKRLGITKKNYNPDNVEHNALAAMVMFDNINKTSLKKFDTYEGNNPDLSKVEKLLYLYNNPGTVKRGEAEGDAIYNKNVLGFNPVVPYYTDDTQYAVTRRFGGPMQNINGENYSTMNLPEGYHLMPDGTVMADDAMEYRKGGAPCYECGGHVYQGGGLVGGPNERPDMWDMFNQGMMASPVGELWEGVKDFPQAFEQGFMDATRPIVDFNNQLIQGVKTFPQGAGQMMDNIALGVASPFLNEAQMKAYYEAMNPTPQYTPRPEMKKGGNWMADIKSTGQCTGANFGGPRCRPGTRQYAFAKRARAGEFKKQEGGSTAQQNTTIDSIGNKRLQLLENNLTKNAMDFFSKQYQEQLKQQLEAFYAKGGSTYDPNMSYADMYDEVQAENQRNLNRDFNKFRGALNTAAANERRSNAMKAKQQEEQAAQAQWASDIQGADSSMYSFANDPNQVPSNFNSQQSAPAWHRYMTPVQSPYASFNYGGQPLPMAKNGKNTGYFDQLIQSWVNPNVATPDIPWGAVALRATPGYTDFKKWAEANPEDAAALVRTAQDPKKAIGMWVYDQQNPEPTAPTPPTEPTGTDQKAWQNYKKQQEQYDQDLAAYTTAKTAYDRDKAEWIGTDVQGAQSGAQGYDWRSGKKPSTAAEWAAAGYGPDTSVINPLVGGQPGTHLPDVSQEELDKMIKEQRRKEGKGTKGTKVPAKDREDVVVKDEREAKKPNYEETKEGADEESSTTMGGREDYYPTYGPFGGVRKRKFKMVYTDPVTGKKVRIKDKNLYDAAGYPVAGGMRGYAGPRNIRIKNKDFTIINGQMVPGRDATAPDVQLNPGEGVRAGDMQRVQPRQVDLSGYNFGPAPNVHGAPDPTRVQYGEGYAQPGRFTRTVTDMPPLSSEDARAYENRMQQAKILQAAKDYQDSLTGYNAMDDLRRSGIPMAGYAYGGDIPMAQAGLANTGDDPYALSSDAWMYGTGLFNDSQQQQQQQQITEVDKMKITDTAKGTGFADAMGTYGVLLDPTLNMIASAAEARKGPSEFEEQARKSTLGTYNPMTDQNKGLLDQWGNVRGDKTAVQFAAARYGGQMQYQDGGIYDLTDEDIAYIESMGGTVQYL